MSEPSPPMQTRASILRETMLYAALTRPSRVRNSLLRAVPITVPPSLMMPVTSRHWNLWIISSDPSTMPVRQ